VCPSQVRVGIEIPAFELRSRMMSRQPRSNMDASGSPSKRQLDGGIISSPSFARPRRAASVGPVEPLSFFPDHASPSGVALRSVEMLNLQRDAAPESRVIMSMTVQEYLRLMQVSASELATARSLGRDEGATAMERGATKAN
jgi:hypothetical protein